MISILSLGHSNVGWDEFSYALDQFDIGCIIDVRSSPRSRWAHFCKPELRVRLNRVGVSYVHLGDNLGGIPRSGPIDYATRCRSRCILTSDNTLLSELKNRWGGCSAAMQLIAQGCARPVVMEDLAVAASLLPCCGSCGSSVEDPRGKGTALLALMLGGGPLAGPMRWRGSGEYRSRYRWAAGLCHGRQDRREPVQNLCPQRQREHIRRTGCPRGPSDC